MSVYSRKGKGWRYDFTIRGHRFTQAWFKTKREAQRAENKKRKELEQPQETRTDMDFLELVNRRLDYLRDRTTERYYLDTKYRAKDWVKRWGQQSVAEITAESIEEFLMVRRKVSARTANTELKCLRALFNYAVKKRWIPSNPTDGIEYYPLDRTRKYIPPLADVEAVISVADLETQDYLRVLQETLARVGEIDRLTWDDVDFDDKTVTLYTRKKRDRSLTPRKVPMTTRVLEILKRRFDYRDPSKPWVFWHRYWSRKKNYFVEEPFKSRNKLMKRLCRKAKVRHFSFHALRHAGASILEQNHVPVGTVQQILGHEDITTTQIYLQSLAGAEREAMRIFETVLENSHTDSHTESAALLQETASTYLN